MQKIKRGPIGTALKIIGIIVLLLDAANHTAVYKLVEIGISASKYIDCTSDCLVILKSGSCCNAI